jgi:hypothetical protein
MLTAIAQNLFCGLAGHDVIKGVIITVLSAMIAYCLLVLKQESPLALFAVILSSAITAGIYFSDPVPDDLKISEKTITTKWWKNETH